MELNFQTTESEATAPLSFKPSSKVPSTAESSATSAGIAEHKGLTALLALADSETRSRRWLSIIPIIIAMQVAIIAAYPHSSIAAFTYATTVFSLVFVPGRFGMRWRRTTEALAAADDVRMVGPLVDRLRVGRRRRRTRRVVRQALIKLLPRLRESDASLLTAEQHSRLTATLRHLAMRGRDTELQLAILTALRQIGGVYALPTVEGLAHNRSASPNRRRVRAAAEACLPYLIPRAEQERSRGTLLRAASGGTGVSSQLLRAASGAVAGNSRELLRATAHGAESKTGE